MKFATNVSRHSDGERPMYSWAVRFGPMVLDCGAHLPTEAAARARAQERLAEIMAEAGVQFVEAVA